VLSLRCYIMCNIVFFREACLGGLRLAEPTHQKGIQCFLTHNNLCVVWVYTYTVESREWFPGCFATRLEGRANLLPLPGSGLGYTVYTHNTRGSR
jgi:hypothetical protein